MQNVRMGKAQAGIKIARRNINNLRYVVTWDKGFMTVLLLLSRSVLSDSLQPHELQHARLLCPSPTYDKKWRGTKEILKVKEDREKAGLKLSIQKK